MDFEAHLLPLYMYSSVDMKYRLWDMRRLGITPVINEANISTAIGIFPGYNGFGSIGPDAPGVTVNDSPFAQLIAANCLNIFLYDMIRYGAVKDIGFWTNALNGGAVYNPELGIFSRQSQNDRLHATNKTAAGCIASGVERDPGGAAAGLL